MKPPGSQRIRKKGKLLPRPARRLHQMQLRHISESRGNQHLARNGTPVRQRRRPKRPITPRRRRQRRRNRRHPIHHQILSRRNRPILRKRDLRAKHPKRNRHHREESSSLRSSYPPSPASHSKIAVQLYPKRLSRQYSPRLWSRVTSSLPVSPYSASLR